jgi:tRNA G46 methylase TrmB
MKVDPREISTNQDSVHDDLQEIVHKYRVNDFKKPIAAHTQKAFDDIIAWLDEPSLSKGPSSFAGDIIIDACCGVGESSLALAKQFPLAKVVGVDKSGARLAKHGHYVNTKSANDKGVHHKGDENEETYSNVRVFQADLNDFWRLLSQHIEAKKSDWQVVKQCLFYPNPYPKKSQVQKRWHASPAFPSLLRCCNNIEVRSNWKIYIEEFSVALTEYGVQSNIDLVSGDPITPFERKYSESGQQCWQLQTLAEGEDK